MTDLCIQCHLHPRYVLTILLSYYARKRSDFSHYAFFIYLITKLNYRYFWNYYWLKLYWRGWLNSFGKTFEYKCSTYNSSWLMV
jgi:hypothetical protein